MGPAATSHPGKKTGQGPPTAGRRGRPKHGSRMGPILISTVVSISAHPDDRRSQQSNVLHGKIPTSTQDAEDGGCQTNNLHVLSRIPSATQDEESNPKEAKGQNPEECNAGSHASAVLEGTL